MLVAPAFARCQDRPRLRRVFSAVFAAYLLFFAALVLVCWLQAPLILRVFGPNYSHLSQELPLVALGIGLMGLNSVCCSLNLAKGWIKSLWMSIPVALFAQVAAMVIFDMKSVSGAAFLSISLGAAYLLYSGTVSCFHLNRRAPLA
jgi:O-antigen/teichoic acid export membrane protein